MRAFQGEPTISCVICNKRLRQMKTERDEWFIWRKTIVATRQNHLCSSRLQTLVKL